MSMWRRAWVILLLSRAYSAGAQSLDVRLTESGAPARGGAVVSLLDSAGRTVREALAGPDGRLIFRAPAAGVYRVRVRRIGYSPLVSDTIILGREGSRLLPVSLPAAQVVLPAVTVVDRGKDCQPGDTTGRLGASMLWDAVRTSLAATEISQRQSLVAVKAEGFTRTLDAHSHVTSRSTTPLGTTYGNPFASPNPNELSAHGYASKDADDVIYSAPDAQVLLSSEFATEHCFGTEPGGRAHVGQVGLTFDPTADRQVTEIAGTMWVDSASLELRSVEFQYVHAPTPIRVDSIGGRIDFARLSSGAWIVSAWLLRMPRIERMVSPDGGTYGLAGFSETGGTATALTATHDAVAAPGRIMRMPTLQAPRLTGLVFDSLLGHPLSTARLRIEGTDITAVSDSAGRFDIDSVPLGHHQLVLVDSALDAIGLAGLHADFDATPGSISTVDVETPSLRTLERGACDEGAELLTGVVRDAGTNARLHDAAVHVSWLVVETDSSHGPRATVRELEAPVDSSGRYLTCVPPNVDATAYGAADQPTRRTSGIVDVHVGPRHIGALDLYVPSESDRTSVGVPRGSAAQGTAALVGYVRDAHQRAIVGATVAVGGSAATAKTDTAGYFDLRFLPSGSRSVTVRGIGFAPATAAVVLRPDRATEQDVTLDAATRLAAVSVTARSGATFTRAAEFNARRKLGFGYSFGPDEIAKSHVHDIQSILESVPGLRVGTIAMDDPHMNPLHPAGSLAVFFATGLTAGQGYCDAQIYIDGQYDDFVDDLRRLSLDEVAAVEVYRQSSQAPQKYVDLRNGCGVILIWTKGAGWR